MTRTGRMLLSLLLLAAVLAAALPVGAQTALDGALARLGSTKFDEVEAGIAGLAASGDPRAPAVLEALADGRLLVRADKVILVKAPDGAVTEAATGAPAEAAGAKPVRVNNRVRRALDAALGSLTLASPDPAKRLAAAESVFARPDAGALPAVEQALAAEADAGVRAAFARARAAILLEHGATPAARAEGAAALAASPSPAALGKLRGALLALPADADPELRAAIDGAVASIEHRQRLLGFAESLFHGVSLGSVLLLAAIGLAITFGVMGVINMAHGEMVMLGAYTTYVVQEFCRTSLPGGLPFALLAALPLAFLVTGAVGVLIERGVISRLYGRPLETLLATWGLSLILQQAVRSLFGPNNREVSTPAWMSGLVELAPGLSLTMNRLVIVAFGLAVFALVVLVIARTRFGLEMRAVTQNRRMAASMGIRTGRVDALTFGLGSGIAGIAGVALSQIDNVSPNLGQGYIVDSFMVVVFGGVGNLWGTLSAAMALGVANKFLEPVAGAVLGKILVLVALILFIQKRPQGLFALKGRAAEA
jgi:urea transport system permease protein